MYSEAYRVHSIIHWFRSVKVTYADWQRRRIKWKSNGGFDWLDSTRSDATTLKIAPTKTESQTLNLEIPLDKHDKSSANICT